MNTNNSNNNEYRDVIHGYGAVPRTPYGSSKRSYQSPRQMFSLDSRNADFSSNDDPQELIRLAKLHQSLAKDYMQRYVDLMDNDVEFWQRIVGGDEANMFLIAMRNDGGAELLNDIVGDEQKCITNIVKNQQEVEKVNDIVQDLVHSFSTTEKVAQTFGTSRIEDTNRQFVASIERIQKEVLLPLLNLQQELYCLKQACTDVKARGWVWTARGFFASCAELLLKTTRKRLDFHMLTMCPGSLCLNFKSFYQLFTDLSSIALGFLATI